MWNRINHLGDEQSFFLMERFISGNIYHVDSIIYEHEVRFALPANTEDRRLKLLMREEYLQVGQSKGVAKKNSSFWR